jgi:hypothetical protein
MQATTQLTGKAAVFVRGFMEFYDKQVAGSDTLRGCQEAGLQAVKDLGDDISVAYISRLARDLANEKVIAKSKKGRRFFLRDADYTDEFLDWLEQNPVWGMDLNPDAMGEITERMELLDFFDSNRAVLINKDRPVPKAQFRLLMKLFNEGKLNMAYVASDLPVFVKVKGKAVRVVELNVD